MQELKSVKKKIKMGDLTPIQKFYEGKVIFLTGVTGFIGKMILEKLMRCCSGFGVVYLLIREKKGKTPEKRLEEILNCDLFKNIKNELPELKKKLRVIYGDIEKENLGMEPEDIQVLKDNIQIVLHAAARVRWDDPLKVAATCHIVATRYLIALLKEFKKLEVFVYVSTSYVHREPDFTVPEHIVKKDMSPNQLLNALEWMNDETVEAVCNRILKESNSYLLTKALTENVIEDERQNIPTIIIRPCTITPSYKEPFPGWCDTIQGIQGLMLAAAKGFLRTLYCERDLHVMIIPADTVVNTCITAAWHMATFKQDDVLVLNCVIDYEKLPLVREILKLMIAKRTKYPLVNIYRYPDFTMYHKPFFYHIHAFFDHLIPAIVGDALLFIFTGKTLMHRLYKKIYFLFDVFVRVGRTPWICKTKNFHMVKDRQSKEDTKIFSMDTDDLNWDKYIEDVMYAGRKQVGKEDPSNIPYARKKAKVWWFVTTVLKWIIIFYFINSLFSKIWRVRNHPTSLETHFLEL